jgi:hypothetical protein
MTANFIYLYRGRRRHVRPDGRTGRRADGRVWRLVEKVGPALVDIGARSGTSASVRDDGTEGTPGDLIGYTIVEADDLAAAKALTDGLPFLSNRDGTCAVEIFELLPM